jgi:hypothetical protein
MASITITENKKQLRKAKEFSYAIFNLKSKNRSVEIREVLPFRIKLTNIGINNSYGPGQGAPIGIAIIGYSNYVM